MRDAGKLRILLLGGFEVWYRGRQLRSFESQKARGLLAYLALNRDRVVAREQLAGLLWPEKDDEAARGNLRQALYNLKSLLPEPRPAHPYLLIDPQSVRFNPSSDYWLDVQAFTEAARDLGGAPGTVATYRLARAANLYRGELLEGFFVKETSEFESWLLAEQERLRGLALGVLRALVEAYRERGESRLGIQYATRLVSMEPLSEEGHRSLMLLLALAGERARALAQYQSLHALLDRELGVEPVPQTKALYESLVERAPTDVPRISRDVALVPIVPLVGRAAALGLLRRCWRRVLRNEPQITLVEGLPGVGKTRLVRSVLDEVSTAQPCRILVGRCTARFPRTPLRSVASVLRQALALEADHGLALIGRLPPPHLTKLRALLPEIRDLYPGLSAVEPPFREGPTLREAIAELFALLARGPRGEGANRPLILFVDDIDMAGPASLRILSRIMEHARDVPLWVIATRQQRSGDRSTEPRVPRGWGMARATAVRLAPLRREELEEMARALVGEDDERRLAGVLASVSEGLPLLAVALVNALWDERLLEATDGLATGWHVRDAASMELAKAWGGFGELVRHRLQKLPFSARRVGTLAAVAEQGFDAELLAEAEAEHSGVVELGIEILMDRWFIRQTPGQWHTRGLEAGQGPWRAGARRASFEFDHPALAAAIREQVDPPRRRLLHRRLADTLQARLTPTLEGVEDVCYHFLEAGADAEAYPLLVQAGQRALLLEAPEDAVACYQRALEIASRRADTGDPKDRERWKGERENVGACLRRGRAAIEDVSSAELPAIRL